MPGGGVSERFEVVNEIPENITLREDIDGSEFDSELMDSAEKNILEADQEDNVAPDPEIIELILKHEQAVST